MLYIGLESTSTERTQKAHQYYNEIFETRQADFAFPDNGVEVLADAYNLLEDPSVLAYFIYAYPECQWEKIHIKAITGRDMLQPLAACHLTSFQGLTANAHFSVHPEFAPFKNEIRRAGKQFLKWLFGLTRLREPGLPLVETLIGLTPGYNIPAIRFALSMGFEKQIVIRNGMFSRHKSRYCDVVMMLLPREKYK